MEKTRYWSRLLMELVPRSMTRSTSPVCGEREKRTLVRDLNCSSKWSYDIGLRRWFEKKDKNISQKSPFWRGAI